MSAVNGDIRASCVDFRMLQKIAQHIDRKPEFIAYYVSRGIRDRVNSSILLCLKHLRIENAELSQLQVDLDNLSISIFSALDSFDFAMGTDKMGTEDVVQRFFTDNGKGDGYFLLDLWEKELGGEWDNFGTT